MARGFGDRGLWAREDLEQMLVTCEWAYGEVSTEEGKRRWDEARDSYVSVILYMTSLEEQLDELTKKGAA